MAIVKATEMNIKTFFASDKYEIPTYQRGYSWEKSELSELWEDMLNQMASNDFEHFLGQIVIHSDNKRKFIIDGQQRITTVIILASVIRSYYNFMLEHKEVKGKDTELKEDLERAIKDVEQAFIGSISRRSDTLKLKLGRTGKDYFFKHVQTKIYFNTKLDEGKTIAEKNIKNAINYFRMQIKEFMNGKSIDEKINALDSLFICMGERMQISYIETDDQTQAFIIFETLNARGISLATSDLLKNHIIRTASEYAREGIIAKWDSMIDNLESINATKYLRTYWNSCEEFIRDKALYKKLRTRYPHSHNIDKLMERLLKFSSYYKSMVKPELSVLGSSEINSILKKLSIISASTFYPLILAMYIKDYPEENILIVLNKILSYYVRNIVVDGQNPNESETYFSDLALQISRSTDNVTNEIINSIEHKTIEDDVFIDRFSKFSSTTIVQVRFLLIEIENKISSGEKIVDTNEIHVEHIMPRSNEIWKFDGEFHLAYLNRLGNLTLLGKEYNIDASNKLFSDKKEQYLLTELNLTKAILYYSKWEKDEIEKRQADLAEIAVQIW